MYEYFEGKIADFYDNNLVIDVCGVGYRIEVPANTLAQIKIGEERIIFVEQVVSENKISVYGFTSIDERRMFNLLRTVPKIGPKTAIQILGGISLSKLVAAIVSSDKSVLTKLPGVGQKSAERLVIDLKDKMKEFEFDIKDIEEHNKTSLHSELIDALTQFGYQRFEIEKAISRVNIEGLDIDMALKLILKSMN